MNAAKHVSGGHRVLEAELVRVYGAICDAFSRLDFNAVLENFADRGLVKISQGQMLKGKQALAENWRQRLHGAGSLRIRIENVEVNRIDDKHAWATADEYISVDGQEVRAIVSNIFVLQDDGWKILLDHTSYLNAND